MIQCRVSVFLTVMASLIHEHWADSVDVINVDEGRNFTVLWKFPVDADSTDFIEILHDTGKNFFVCFNWLDCYFRSHDSRIGLLTAPPLGPELAHLPPPFRETNITDLGLFITKVEPSDAGLYTFSADLFPNDLREVFVLYVYRKPTKPVVTSTVQTGVIIITCTSTIQSVPEQYRNTSQLEYIWIVNSSMDNYDLDGNQIRINNAQKGKNTASFSCIARELNSTTVSEPSDILVLYLRNITLDVWLLFDDPHKVNLVCNADCKPPCSYEWLNEEEGKLISTNNSLILEDIDDVRPPTCVAINGLGSLSKRAARLLEEVSQHNKQDVVLSLSVCLALALAVAVITGTLLIILLRRQRKRDHQTEQGRPAVSEREPSGVYEKTAISHDTKHTTTTYDQLSRSRDPLVQPSSYEVISVINTSGMANASNVSSYK